MSFGKRSMEVLVETISTAGITPIEKRIAKFFRNLKVLATFKTLQLYLGLVTFYRRYLPIQSFPRKYDLCKVTQLHLTDIFERNESVIKASSL